MMVPLRGSPIYPTVSSPTTPGQQSYPGGLATTWESYQSLDGMHTVYFLCSAENSGNFILWVKMPFNLLHACKYTILISKGQLGSVSSPESQQQTGNSQIYGNLRQSESVNAGSQGAFSPYRSGSAPLGIICLAKRECFS
ncbi:PROTEIN PHOSPHATASE RELATED [Salix koriyanagi]|uniref:PROTEIN PHOSPHATASE RELATED n=1 Tax=Salix koriyanagi TaxID=2511006 RepID=A0A9Q1A480_9ROSI|nr:PROTEIN PHOSPHATASE RELATED [Salix koriyanagi]